jgi:uncharacterized protein (DUF58 family)
MTDRRSLVAAGALLAAVSVLVVWGHAGTALPGVDAAVSEPTCEGGNVTAVSLTVTNEGPAPRTLVFSVHPPFRGEPSFWARPDGSSRLSVPVGASRTARFVAPGPAGAPAPDRTVVLTVRDGQRRLDFRGWFTCGEWHPMGG